MSTPACFPHHGTRRLEQIRVITHMLVKNFRPFQPTCRFNEHAFESRRLMKCEEIVCRAWQGQNTQPQNITWNLLGMMNNCWFRCKVHPTRDDRGALALTFEHPTMPGPQPGGWMVKGEGGVVANKAPPPKVRCIFLYLWWGYCCIDH